MFSCLSAAHSNTENQRIITLSPHLTEIVFALGKGEHLVAVSDYSDFPKEASSLPSVASFEGANIAQIIRLKPSHVLVWRGGNKDADIEKLKALNLPIYESSVTSVESLLTDITNIGNFIAAKDAARKSVETLSATLALTRERYKGLNKTAVYYLNKHPLVGLGNDQWLNSLLGICSINNLYEKSLGAYPQLQMPDIIRKQPEVIIAATLSEISDLEQFWSPHKKVLDSKIVSANPDALHRFTGRAINEMAKLCATIYD
jgi:vitamin B12 transport system substrate-binding protein